MPTLIVQGTVDTLFTLDEAAANYAALRKQGIPLKMVFMCGGHGVCLTKSDSGSAAFGDSAHAQEARLDGSTATCAATPRPTPARPSNGSTRTPTFHTSERFPLKPAGTLTGSGSGTLPLIPGSARRRDPGCSCSRRHSRSSP